MRILLAAEGESDEIVAEALIKLIYSKAEIVRKRFPARGIEMVRRSIPTLVKATHYQRFDALVVHFDLDDTVPAVFESVCDSPRWQEICEKITKTIPSLKDVQRQRPVLWTLMAPAQATDAWLIWGRDNQDGTMWESKNRHTLKESLFGQPPRNIVETATTLSQSLLTQLDGESKKPRSLEQFLDSVRQMVETS